MAKPKVVRRICFVTGTRAEFGLMASTLRAIGSTPGLTLQLIATGMHLDPRQGDALGRLRAEGWPVDAVVPWPVAATPTEVAARTGSALAELAAVYERLGSDIVLVVGDRVEAFAAAAAAHVAGRIVAHVHGGDRALGQVDDSLRHATSKLAHVHFAATVQSAARLAKLGEDRWRIHRVGSPGIDGIVAAAIPAADVRRIYAVEKKAFALVALHPTDADDRVESHRAALVLDGLRAADIEHVVVIGPNNDPGSAGILSRWQRESKQIAYHADVPRGDFLGLLRDAAFLIGNSSSGIIEAASFGTAVINVGDRQMGRERGGNVRDVPFERDVLARIIGRTWRGGRPVVYPRRNVYGGGGAGLRLARTLLGLTIDDRLRRKLISY